VHTHLLTTKKDSFAYLGLFKHGGRHHEPQEEGKALVYIYGHRQVDSRLATGERIYSPLFLFT
jgi:hypothetical protein